MKGWPDNPSGSKSLAARLSARGFRCVSIPAIATKNLDHPGYAALVEGFDEVAPGAVESRPLQARNQAAIAQRVLASKGEKRLFMWLHFMDPHHPYTHHPAHDFGSEATDRYDSEIAFTDQAIGAVLKTLKTLGLAENTCVVINADHGEAFGEHDTMFHGTTLYDEQIKVPCMIRVPTLAPQRVAKFSGNVDLLPTVLDVLGIDDDQVGQGQSLLPYLMHGSDSPYAPLNYAFAEIPDAIPAMAPENTGRQALLQGRYKLITNQRADFVELYDLATDPGETLNIAARKTDIKAGMMRVVRSLIRESRNVNLPAGAKDDKEIFAELREALRGGQVPERRRLLVEHLKRDHQEMRTLALEILSDPEEHFLVKLAILAEGGHLLHDAMLPYMRDLLRAPPVLGAASTALDVWTFGNLPLTPEDRELVVLNMARHPHVGWRAARLLAKHGDARSKLHLAPALVLGDPETAFESACALGLLEDASGLEIIRRGLWASLGSPERCSQGISALAKLGDRRSLVHVVEIARNRYRHFKIKRAALEYLLMIAGEDALPGLCYLSSNWDPEIGREVKKAVTTAYGADVAVSIAKVAVLLTDANELTTQGENHLALKKMKEVLDLLGTPRAAAPFAILAGRLMAKLGDVDGAQVLWRGVEDSKAPVAYRRAARSLRRMPQATSHRKLSLVELKPVSPRPVRAFLEQSFVVKLRNDGTAFVSGGDDADALLFSIEFFGTMGKGEIPVFLTPLPHQGLAPGESTEFCMTTAVPGLEQFYSFELKAMGPMQGRTTIRDRREEKVKICIRDMMTAGLDPSHVVFKGKDLLALWTASSAFNPAVVDTEGRLALLANQLDPILIGPVFKNVGRPLEVSVTFETENGDGKEVEYVELFYRFAKQANFLGHQKYTEKYAIGKGLKTMTFKIDPVAGESPVQLRVDFFQMPHFVKIHQIRVRTLAP